MSLVLCPHVLDQGNDGGVTEAQQNNQGGPSAEVALECN